MFFTERNKKLRANVQKLEELEKKVISFNQENKELLRILESRDIAIQKIISEKSLGFPWLAEAIAEFYEYQDLEIARYLEIKSHPAYTSAQAVREVARKNKVLKKQAKIAQNFVALYENLFPWINEYVGEDLDELLEAVVQTKVEEEEDEIDPVLKFIPKAEYEKLPESERNQKALDRYLVSRKKSYEIGRDYERYIGYLYESDGYEVQYVGIEDGLEDLGRDLICTKGDTVEVVQCKYWASYKVIREKYINQLYGTAVKYYIEHKQITDHKKTLVLFPDLITSGQIQATLITSTKLSDTAAQFAKALGVKIIEEKPLDKYPLIKCNIRVDGEKIYHLPFDQQYDRTLIKNKGEFYAATVKEAENSGFRRAFRWRGNKK